MRVWCVRLTVARRTPWYLTRPGQELLYCCERLAKANYNESNWSNRKGSRSSWEAVLDWIPSAVPETAANEEESLNGNL